MYFQSWRKFFRGWVIENPHFFAPNNAFGALTQPLFQQHSEGCKTRCSSHLRDAGPEKLVAEVNIISVALNQASLFSLYWDFEKIFYNIEKVWRFRQWGLCVWGAERNTNDQDSLRLMYWNISSMGRINRTPPVLLAWHRACLVLD